MPFHNLIIPESVVIIWKVIFKDKPEGIRDALPVCSGKDQEYAAHT